MLTIVSQHFMEPKCSIPDSQELLDLIILIILGEEYKSQNSSYAVFSILPSSHPSPVHISSSAPCSQTPLVYVPPLMTKTKFYTQTELQAKL
jgi:hypothetical protein